MKKKEKEDVKPLTPEERGMNRTRSFIMIGLALGLLVSSLDQTVVGTSLPKIVGDLGGMNLFAWLFTAYMLGEVLTSTCSRRQDVGPLREKAGLPGWHGPVPNRLDTGRNVQLHGYADRLSRIAGRRWRSHNASGNGHGG